MSIPVVDFGAYNINQKDVSDELLHGLSKELKAAFTEVGFVFLTNAGITQEEVAQVQDIAMKFFLQPEEMKQPFKQKSFEISQYHGWVSMDSERLHPDRPEDLKEAYNVSTLHPDIKWPSGAVESFQEIHTSFFLRCKELGLRVLRVIAHSLDLDPEVFLSAHHLVGMRGNNTTLRSLYYPPVNSVKVKENQLRCGEHSDFGSITLLFQGSEGLQVLSRSGEFINVPCIPGAVLINIADMMQRWTSDQYISVLHRVLLPPAGDSSTRQSTAFFLYPDDEAVITCYDGSNKYPPVTGAAYAIEKFHQINVATVY
ncbi:UPF0676 protein C1494.01-like [Cheilinus undulatus]|uniref:UPF0676 protein C1494.01-like n=1 Tax=Cheilinus undulatus TaxID=241271 RepID=UPI001BD3ECD0|nr:UPF0676 protein C1494.01-like [Cheilinus undulatus]